MSTPVVDAPNPQAMPLPEIDPSLQQPGSKFEALREVDFREHWDAYGELYSEEKPRAMYNEDRFRHLDRELFGPQARHPKAERVMIWYRRAGAFNGMNGAEEDLVRGANIITNELDRKPELATPELRLEAASMLLESGRATEVEEEKWKRLGAAQSLLEEIVGDNDVDWTNDAKFDAQMHLIDLEYDQWAANGRNENVFADRLLKNIEMFNALSEHGPERGGPTKGKLFEMYDAIKQRHFIYAAELFDSVTVRKSYTREDEEISNNQDSEANENFDLMVTRKKGDKTIEIPIQCKSHKDDNRRYRRPIIVHAEDVTVPRMRDGLRVLAKNVQSTRDARIPITNAELSEVGRQVSVLSRELKL